MSIVAVLCFKSGKFHDGSAPCSVDPEGRYAFGRNFPKMIDLLDESAVGLGVPAPRQFVWTDPFCEEGNLDRLGPKAFEQLRLQSEASATWIPIERGIVTFQALALRHSLKQVGPGEVEPASSEYYVAFEVACYLAALEEAAVRGEQEFHIEII